MAFVAPLTVLMLILPTVLKLDDTEAVAAENELAAFPGVIVNGLSPDNITCPNTAAESVAVAEAISLSKLTGVKLHLCRISVSYTHLRAHET